MMMWDIGLKPRFLAICAITLVAAWSFEDRVIVPLTKRKAEVLRAAGEMEKRTDGMQGTIDAVAARKQTARGKENEMERMKNDCPPVAAILWLPPMLREHFGRLGITTTEIRLNTVRDEPHVAGCERSFWFVRLPLQEGAASLATLLLSVEELDRRNPFLRVLDFSIRPDPEEAKRRIMVLNLGLLSPKARD